jgi:hypothetical protein
MNALTCDDAPPVLAEKLRFGTAPSSEVTRSYEYCVRKSPVSAVTAMGVVWISVRRAAP